MILNLMIVTFLCNFLNFPYFNLNNIFKFIDIFRILEKPCKAHVKFKADIKFLNNNNNK